MLLRLYLLRGRKSIFTYKIIYTDFTLLAEMNLYIVFQNDKLFKIVW
jgi:hypothetical protein